MSKDLNINVKHVTRIEGHGNIVVNAKNGKIEKLEWQVPEAPRFFEGFVRGLKYEDIQTVVSRICGICSITHSLAATKAVENALGLEVSEQADMIRILMHYSEQLQSHTLHVGYLAVPDFFGVKSVVPLVGTAAATPERGKMPGVRRSRRPPGRRQRAELSQQARRVREPHPAGYRALSALRCPFCLRCHATAG